MREGLRSAGKLRERRQKDEGFSGKVLIQKKHFDMVRKVADTCPSVKDVLPETTNGGSVEDARTEKLDDSGTYSGEWEAVNGCEHHEGLEYKKKRREEERENGCEHHEALQYKKKRRREDGGDSSSECLGTEKRNAREEVSDGEWNIVGRVLRSRMKPNHEVGEERTENNVAKIEKKRGGDHKNEMKTVKIEEHDGSYELVERIVEKTFKGKQGRRPKTNGTTPKRRGRPPLARGSLGVSRNQLKRKVGGLRKSKRISETKDKLRQSRLTRSSNRETRSSNDFKSKSPFSYVEVKHANTEIREASPAENLEAGTMVSFDEHSVTETGKSYNDGEEAGLTRASEKQLVRDRIIELLFGAGWTVDYRPRHGREYKDAVYVSPDGKTHWSITLAYRVLKQRYEDGDTGAYKEGFVFSPIPVEELDILKRVQINKREGKKKWKVLKGGRTPDRAAAVKKKKQKKKKGGLLAGVNACKNSLDGRLKRNSLQFERDDCVDSHCAYQSSANRKRRQTQNRKRCALLVRRSDGAESDADGYVLYNGRRTTLAWMIDSGVMVEKAMVSYMSQSESRAMLQGKITREGIDCGCCGEVVTTSEFEFHAGSKLCRPLQNIFVENGTSILQCQLGAWNKLESEQKWFHFIDVGGDDPNDDTCGICGDGGNLVCCDGCPSTFHQNCLDIQKFPSGDWYCLYCICKYCSKTGEDIYQQNIEGTQASLYSCSLCEGKYHKPCIHADDVMQGGEGEPPFCGRRCQEIYKKIETLLGVKHEMEDGFSWTLVRRCEVGADISSSEVPRKIECNSKLAVALLVMDECFLPSSDHRSGINLIHNILYSCGSNFNRLNFSGFYTVTLEMGDEIVSVASIRIHGNILAEMPYIGTRYMYRRQGMCRRLLTAVESVLRTLNVEKLVIPAISELKDTWTSVFGFEPLEASTKKVMRSMNVLVFPGINMLQKPMLSRQFTEVNAVRVEGLIPSEGEDHPIMNETMEVVESDKICLEKLDMNIASEVTVAADETEGKASFLKSSSHLLNGSSNDLSDITSESIDCTNCPRDNLRPTKLGDEPSDILVGESANECVQDTDSDGCKQAKEIHVQHLNADSDSIPLTSEKSDPQAGITNCSLGSPDPTELDGDVSCDVKAGNRPRPFTGSLDKDSQQRFVDGDPSNGLHDSIPLIGSSGSEPTCQWSDDMDENGVCPSPSHQVGDLQPNGKCGNGCSDCSLSTATSDPDFNHSVIDKMSAKIIQDSVPAVENDTDNPSD